MNDPSRPVTGYPAHPNTTPNGHSTTATGTAYPYATGPQSNTTFYPPPQQPNPYYGYDPYRERRATFLRRIFAIFIACIIITGTVCLIVWLVIRPRVPEFRVNSVSVTNFNLSNSLISGNWDVEFTVINPNKKISLKYDHIDANVFYKSESLSEASVPPFSQGTRNTTVVRATFAAFNSYVDESVVRGINGDRGGGNVRFTVRLWARVGFKTGAWRTRKRIIRVLCRDIPVGLSANSGRGSLVGGSRDCRVDL